MRILVVEDDRAVTQSLVATLKAASMVVDAVETGEEALEYCRLYDFDMVLLDLSLPDMEGYDVVRRLRAARLATPVLMLSKTASPRHCGGGRFYRTRRNGAVSRGRPG